MSPDLTEKNYSPSNGGTLELTVPPDCAGLRLDQALSRLLPAHSRSRLTQWIRDQYVTVDGRRVLPRLRMHGGELLNISVEPVPSQIPAAPEAIPLEVIFEDSTILIINKPPGLVVHPGHGNWSGTLMNALLARAPQLAHVPRAGIVHRLDKDTSGLLVVAKTPQAQTSLVRQLQARSVKREYLAIVYGHVERDGRVDAPIGRHRMQRTRMTITSGGKPATTHYQVLKRFQTTTLLRCRLETGRTHQIRVHMQSIGHPLVGDTGYAGNRRAGAMAVPFPRQALHAEHLELLHPESGASVAWRAEPPADMRALLVSLDESTGHAT